jgi:hypothetical protein
VDSVAASGMIYDEKQEWEGKKTNKVAYTPRSVVRLHLFHILEIQLFSLDFP